MIDILHVAEQADMIVNGYAYTKDDKKVRILNLNNPSKAVSLDIQGNVLETSMDDIEIQLVKKYLSKNSMFMED